LRRTFCKLTTRIGALSSVMRFGVAGEDL